MRPARRIPFHGLVRSFARARRGAVAVLFAIMLVPLLLAVGAGVDFARLEILKSSLQSVADGAALAGATALNQSGSSGATTVATGYFNKGVANLAMTATVGAPVVTVPTTTSVRVTATATLQMTLMALVTGTMAVKVLASAQSTTTGLPACVVSKSTVQVDSSINLNGCGMVANDTGSQAILVNGGTSVTASIVSTPGTILNNGTINAPIVSSPITNNGSGSTTATSSPAGSAATDPFLSYQSQASSGFPSSCTTSLTISSSTTLATPGCWSSVIVNSGVLTLGAGTFFFSNLQFNSGSLVATSGSGTTVVVQYGFTPNVSFKIVAPTSGSWAGMAIYDLTSGINMNSNVQYSVTGAIYAPNGTITMGAGTWNANVCTDVVANSITFNGSSAFTLPQTGCSGDNIPIASTSGGASSAALRQ